MASLVRQFAIGTVTLAIGSSLLAQTVKVTPLGSIASKVPVHVPLSGRMMEFDAGGRCGNC